MERRNSSLDMKKLTTLFSLVASVCWSATVSYQSMTNYTTGYVASVTTPMKSFDTNLANYTTNLANLTSNRFNSTSNSVTVTNLALTVPQWIDILANYSFSTTGPSAPSLTAVTNGSVIQELAFDNNDILYAQVQFPHNLAITNAAFPVFYWEPHVHFSTIGTIGPVNSNVTWRIEWEVASINGAFTNRGTNTATMGVTNDFTHRVLELGHITNSPPLGISAVFRCRLTRPASALRDYGTGHDVLLDGFDLHVPVGNAVAIGSREDNSQ